MGDKIAVIAYHGYTSDVMYVKPLLTQMDTYRKSKDWVLAMTSVVAERSNFSIVKVRKSTDDVGPRDTLKAMFDSNEDALAEITMTHSWDNTVNQVQGEITVKFESLPQSSDVMVGLFVIEDSIIAPQTNYYDMIPSYPSLYQKGVYIQDYRHDNVLRAEILDNSYWGKSLTSSAISAGEEYKVSFDYTIPAKYVTLTPNIDYLSLIAFTCANNGEVYNAVKLNLVKDAVAINTYSDNNTLKDSKNGRISAIGSGEFLLDISSDANYSVTMYDIHGRIIAQKREQFSAGKHKISLMNNQKAAGLFVVTLERFGQIICKENMFICE